MSNKKFIKIALDLDGVIIDKPPLIPKKIIEWLYKGKQPNGLHYKFPGKLEQKIRLLSHLPLLRPPIRQNITYIKQLAQKRHIYLYAISSRYSFLEKITNNWLKKQRLNHVFKKIYLNTQNQQPQLFKEKILQKLKPSVFIDDDHAIITYLERQKPKTKTKLIYCSKNNLLQSALTVLFKRN